MSRRENEEKLRALWKAAAPPDEEIDRVLAEDLQKLAEEDPAPVMPPRQPAASAAIPPEQHTKLLPNRSTGAWIMKHRFALAAAFAIFGGLALFLWPSAENETPKDPALSAATRKATNPGRKVFFSSGGSDFQNAEDPTGDLVLEGQAVDLEGNPVQGALVAIDSHPRRTARTNEYGWFAFENLPGRPYVVEAHKDELYAGPIRATLTRDFEPLLIRMSPSSSLEVTVLDARDKSPIEKAKIKITSYGMALERSAETDARGRAFLSGLRPGGLSVLARAEGYGPGSAYFTNRGDPEILEQQTIELQPGAAVKGIVLGPDGNPVPGADVGAEWVSQGFSDIIDTIKTDAEGRFRFGGLAEGSYRFRAAKNNFAPATTDIVSHDGVSETKGITIRLEEGATISGKVVSLSGEPVAGALVKSVRVDEATVPFDTFRQVYSDKDGVFVLKGLARKPIALQAMHESGVSERLELDLQEQSEARDVTLVLEFAETIEGVVVDSSGEPVPEVQVMALAENYRQNRQHWRVRSLPQETTDLEGRFVLRGLPPGKYLINAARPGARLSLSQSLMWGRGVKAETGETNVRVVLQEDGAIKGRVLWADGSAPSSFTLTCRQMGKQEFHEKDGTFLLKNVPPGDHVCAIFGPEFTPRELGKVTVKPGEEANFGTITIEHGGTVTGRVLREDGSPVAGAKIFAGTWLSGGSRSFWGDGRDRKQAISAEDGSFSISGLDKGRPLSIAAEHPQEGRSQLSVVVTGETAAVADLVLLPTGSLEGKITYGGKPTEANVVAQPVNTKANSLVQVKANAEGFYLFEKLAPGEYKIWAQPVKEGLHSAAFPSKTARITIEPKQTASLDIDIPNGPTVIVRATLPNGKAVEKASIYLLEGDFSAATRKELIDAIRADEEDRIRQGWISAEYEQEAEFGGVVPGKYTLCGFEVKDRKQKNDNQPVVCERLTVKESPARQEVTLKLRAP